MTAANTGRGQATRGPPFGLHPRRRIENPEIGSGVDTGARDPLPAHRVAGGSASQSVPEPCLATPPVDRETLGEERGRDHARPVVHLSGAPELAHADVDDRIAGLPARLPTLALLGCCRRRRLALNAAAFVRGAREPEGG